MARKQRKKLPAAVRMKRWAYAERLFREGLSIGEVNAKVRSKYERPMNWKTYRAIQARVLAEGPVEDLDEVAQEAAETMVSVQPVRAVNQKLRLRLQSVVNEMRKGGIEKLTVDSAGGVQVVFTPAETVFDLEG